MEYRGTLKKQLTDAHETMYSINRESLQYSKLNINNSMAGFRFRTYFNCDCSTATYSINKINSSNFGWAYLATFSLLL